jgi:hypothetical protein
MASPKGELLQNRTKIMRISINIMMYLLKALCCGVRKKPLLGKHIPNAGNNRRIAVSITIEENEHC